MKSYSLHELDLKIIDLIGYENGFFIEAGANDGIRQSNTYLLEKDYGWTGLLVDPNPNMIKECALNRPNSIVEHYALVSSNYKKKSIIGDFNGCLMSSVHDENDWDNPFFHKQKTFKNLISVPAITLTKLLQKHNASKVDFFSLDVEGYEISVLNGLDFSIFRPKYILIETSNNFEIQEKIRNYMNKKQYNFLTALSGNDDLFIDSTNK